MVNIVRGNYNHKDLELENPFSEIMSVKELKQYMPDENKKYSISYLPDYQSLSIDEKSIMMFGKLDLVDYDEDDDEDLEQDEFDYEDEFIVAEETTGQVVMRTEDYDEAESFANSIKQGGRYRIYREVSGYKLL